MMPGVDLYSGLAAPYPCQNTPHKSFTCFGSDYSIRDKSCLLLKRYDPRVRFRPKEPIDYQQGLRWND